MGELIYKRFYEKRKRHIEYWEPEDDSIGTLKEKGLHRNLWISIPSLLCGFAIWMYWSIVTVQMLNIGLPFTQPELFTLAAIGGLSGATLRIPSSFIRIAGGRNTIFLTTVLLMIPALVLVLHFRTPQRLFGPISYSPYFQESVAEISASSMSNISFFLSQEEARSCTRF